MRQLFSSLAILLILTACATQAPVGPATSASDPIASSDTLANAPVSEPRSPYQPSRFRQHDLLHTRLALSFDWAQELVLGEAWLQLTPYFASQSIITLDAKGMQWHTVALLSGEEQLPLTYTYDSLQITIQLDRTYTKGEQFWLYLDYTADPSSIPGFGNEAIQGEQGLYFINPTGTENKPTQIWTQGETQFSSCWFPTIDAPNERTTQEIYLTVPQQYQTLSNGRLVSSQAVGDSLRTDYWKMDQPHAPYLFMVAVGEWAVVEDSWKGIPLQYWVEPAFAPYAKAIFGNTPEMISFFSEKLGVAFPWSKYSQVVVRDFVSGAMENTTASVFMEDLQVDSRSLLDYHWDGIIAHELFHQWFGDLVTCESWANLPLNESFANYSEYLWIEHKYGQDSADYHALEEMFDYFEEGNSDPKALIRYYHNDPGDMFDRHSYNKGGRVLHMLRRYLGDDAFFAGLKLYLTKNAYQAVEIHHLRLAFEEVTGQDLNWFFNQWFLLPGHPSLQVLQSYDSTQAVFELNIVQSQDLDQAPLYQIPLTLEFWYDGQPSRQVVWIDRTAHTFRWEGPQPELVIVDPEKDLLGYIYHEVPQEMLFRQARWAGHFYHRVAAFSVLAQRPDVDPEALYQLAVDGVGDPFWLNRLIAIETLASLKPEQTNAHAQIFTRLAAQDPVPLVRADALTFLAELPDMRDTAPFYRGLKDSAYSVVGAAVAGLAMMDVPEYTVKSALAPYESYTNTDVILPLADYFSSAKVEDKLSWFLAKLDTLGGESRYYFIPYVVEYLQTLSTADQTPGLEALYQVAATDTQYYVQASAINGLRLLDVSNSYTEKIDKLLSDGADERLLQMLGE